MTEFQRIARIWRHLLMLKRSGRGHDSQGAAATSQGELAIECPACPHSGCNLPDNWTADNPQAYVIRYDFLQKPTYLINGIDIYILNFLQLMAISNCG